MNSRPFSNWITCPRPNPQAALRLFCLPFAGGGASLYRAWGATLAPLVEVCPIQLPGREERHREAAVTNLTALAQAIARELTPFLTKPFAMFGHSMGALTAFEVARALRRSQAPEPAMLFAASYLAPQDAARRRPIHDLPDAEFIGEMRRLQGTAEAVLQNDELMAFVLPVLRADFRACDTYEYTPEPPLCCPLITYGGAGDAHVSAEQLDAWRAQTAARFEQRLFPGNHFFLQSHRHELLTDIAPRLSALAGAQNASR